MVRYGVKLADSAYYDIDSAAEWLTQFPSGDDYALEWRVDVLSAIRSLRTMPLRYPAMPLKQFPQQQLRQLIQGEGRWAFRIIYTVEAKLVTVIHIWHTARDAMPEEFND